MKLGSQTGSLTNHLYSRMTIGQPKVEVGMGATILMWTDRKAVTVVEVLKNGKYIKVQFDDAKRIDKNGMSECQEYEYTRNLEAPIYTFKCEKDGSWKEAFFNPATGRYKKRNGGNGLRIGSREQYHDYSF